MSPSCVVILSCMTVVVLFPSITGCVGVFVSGAELFSISSVTAVLGCVEPAVSSCVSTAVPFAELTLFRCHINQLFSV